MKKTLIAIAALVAATGSFAQSAVSIDGQIDAGIVNYNYRGASITGVDRNLSSTSMINIRGNTDLGGGLKAAFVVENDFNATSNAGNTGVAANSGAGASGTGYNGSAGTAFGNGETSVSLSSAAMGKISAGVVAGVGAEYLSDTAQNFSSNVGSNYGTAMNQVSINGARRNDNTLRYDTPVFSNGLSGTVLYRAQQAPNATTTTLFNSNLGAQSQAKISQFGLRYEAGPLKVLAARTTEDGTNTFAPLSGAGTTAVTANTSAAGAGTMGTMNMFGARYNFGATTVYSGYQSIVKTDVTGVQQRNTRDMNIGATYELGMSKFMAQYNRLTGQMSAATLNTSGGASAFSLGYEYALSKTAALVARYSRFNDDNNNQYYVASQVGTASAGNNVTTKMGAGLRVQF
jgi:predicted porin